MLVWIVLAAVVAVVVAELAFRVLEPALPTHRLWHDTLPAVRVRQMRELRREVGSVDFVLCGASVIHSGVDPAIVADAAGLPIVGYNAALHRGFYAMTGPWLTTTVLPMLRPTVLVLGATIFDLNDNGPLLHEEPERYRQSLLGRPGPVGAAARRLATVSALFRNHQLVIRPRLLARAVGHRRRGTVVPDVDVRGSKVSVGPHGEWTGFHGRSYLTTEAMHTHVAEGVLGDFHLGGQQLAIVERTVADLKKRVPQVLLTNVPISEDLAALLPNGQADIDAANGMLRAMAARLDVPFLDPDFDVVAERDFADVVHVNEHGMAAFSRTLGGLLGDHLRGDPSLLPSPPTRRGR